ncbi:G coupled receptor like [Apiospora rasikravindrae]|uniref:G coupled receptor like n=1 Tax=Apiospora rasikravindrae TaxID=990691 RepID=A0ABR1SL12_9PEZI
MANDSDTLSERKLNAITFIERTGSVFSLLGCIFIIISFSCSKVFHKPINRLVFYASFGNMMSNIGTLMARSYVNDINVFGCQFQAFLIQMFLPADALWTLAMAINVYLTFYFKFDAMRLRNMEIWYFLACYGIPFVPALTYIFISSKDGVRVYGNATLWCWISNSWDVFRIATFYGPVWVVISITFFIYLRAGGEIYKKRQLLRNFSSSATQDPEPLTMDDPSSTKTTEVTVTLEDTLETIGLATFGKGKSEVSQAAPAAYSVTITSDRNKRHSQHEPPSSPEQFSQTNVRIAAPHTRQGAGAAQKRRANFEINSATWSYAKCAILFFTALLVTWIPSSANRVYSLVHPGEISYPLEIMSALVLPLQGFWNALIYIVTSWSGCKMFFSEVFQRSGRSKPNYFASEFHDLRKGAFKRSSRNIHNGGIESESTTELAHDSRPTSNEETKHGTSIL